MQKGLPTRVIGAAFGLAGFAVAVFAGIWSGNDGVTTVSRAILCMIVCQIVGYVIGWIAERAIHEAVAQQAVSNPIPEDETGEGIDLSAMEFTGTSTTKSAA